MKMEIKTFEEKDLNKTVCVVVGTRPGIVMLAPVIHELSRRNIPHFVVHTGQHYSPNMDAQFFLDLELPKPEFRLDGVSEKKTHGSQTAAMLDGIEKVLMEQKPYVVLVNGDANTNLAGALAARKLRMQLCHMEAGERSYDWRMPEEHNRRIMDHISDHLFATGEKAASTLKSENVQGNIYITGNPIVDASKRHFEIAKKKSEILIGYGVAPKTYAVMTTHREENVDAKENLKGALQGVSNAASQFGTKVFFLAHPRAQKRIREFGLENWVADLPGIVLKDAVGYLDFISLLANSKLVFTDSGGVQQEACIHQVPCVTLRENTEWRETLDSGANRLAGCDPQRIVAATSEALKSPKEWPIPFGDGDTSRKTVDILENILKNR